MRWLLESIAAELTAPGAVLDALAAAVNRSADTATPEQVVSQIVEAQSALRRASTALAELDAGPQHLGDIWPSAPGCRVVVSAF